MFIALCGFSQSAKAEVLTCYGCTTQQMKDAAEEELLSVPWGQPHPPAYVINFVNSTVRKYHYQSNVDSDFDWEVDGLETWVVEGVVEQPITQLINQMKSADPGPVALSASDLPPSAWDVVSNVRNDEQVVAHLNTTLTDLRVRLTDYLRGFNPLPFPGFDPHAIMYSIEVEFNDGSTAVYEYDFDKGDWVRRPDSARDKHGNLIPETAEDFSGGDGSYREYTYPLGSDDIDRFLDRAEILHIDVHQGGNANGRTVRIACVDAGGGPVCEIAIF